MRQFNKNDQRRHEILGISYYSDTAKYDIKHVTYTLNQLEQLNKENFLNLEETQNDSPTIAEFIVWLKDNPKFRAHGYVMSPNRDDYRVSIEGVDSYEELTPDEKKKLKQFAKDADEKYCTKKHTYCWWD